jgi:acetate kinase
MIAALDGVDLIVFMGGIGENDPEVRAAICDGLPWIGVRLGPQANFHQRSGVPLPGLRAGVAGGRADHPLRTGAF